MRDRASVYGRQSSGKAKSIQEQLQSGHIVIRDNDWQHVGDYSDGTAASRFGTKVRSEWERVLTDLGKDVFDILILWESSRGDRTLSSWADFLELCREHKIRIHIVADDYTYNMARPRDWKSLATAGVDAAAETDLLSIRVKRGHAGAAVAGLPGGGPVPYGYRRTFDPATGKRLDQVVDPDEAVIVQEIFAKIARGHTVLGLVNDLNERGVTFVDGRSWSRAAIRRIVNNRTYIGFRVMHGTRYKGVWEPIVSELAFHAAQRTLSAPGRSITRPGRQKHLLSYLARCGVCDAFLNHVADCYRCVASGCISVPKALADESIKRAVLEWLSRQAGTAIFSDNGDAQVLQARAEAARLRTTLDEWRASAIKGVTSPASLAVIEAELTAQIGAADVRAQYEGVPVLVQELLEAGENARARWDASPVVARRIILGWLCEVKVGRGRPGRLPAGVDPLRVTYVRFGKSRWRGDTKTWAEHWGG